MFTSTQDVRYPNLWYVRRNGDYYGIFFMDDFGSLVELSFVALAHFLNSSEH